MGGENDVENSANLILVAIASGAIGLLLGAFLMWRGIRPQSRQQLEQRVQEAEQKLRQQQSQLADHFTHTAALVNNLTRNYRDLHDYLASSAQQLGNIDIQPMMIADSKAATILGQGNVINPPLDYAPKKGDIGTLSESYGLRDERPDAPPTADAYADVKP